MTSPSSGAPALKYGYINEETTSPCKAKVLINRNEIIDTDEKLLLWNNLILNNNIYIKNNKIGKGEYLYPCLFKDFVGNDTIKIVFEYDNFSFKKNKDYKVNIDCLIIIPEFVYHYFIYKK